MRYEHTRKDLVHLLKIELYSLDFDYQPFAEMK